jgi:TATA-binding protein-associated factor
MFTDCFCILYQNLVLEEREDIRNVTYEALAAAMYEVESYGCLETAGCSVNEWYGMIMTPPGIPLDTNMFEKAKKSVGHNVDKAMMAGDMSLITMDTFLATRLHAAKALALLRYLTGSDVS